MFSHQHVEVDDTRQLMLKESMTVFSVDEVINLLNREFPSSFSHKKNQNNNNQEKPIIDFLLIGSRALREHYNSEMDDTIYRNHIILKQSRRRFVNIEKSDWDVVCMNVHSLKELLKSSGKNIEEVRINYLVKVRNFTHENIVIDEENESNLRINEILPKEWKEISLCLKLKCGSIIEIEYCNDKQPNLNNYLDSMEVLEKVSVPFCNNSFIAPLTLLEVFKRSHLCQNIEMEKWKTHFTDFGLIRMMKKIEDLYVNPPLSVAIDQQLPLDFIYYERLIKVTVLHTLCKSSQNSDDELFEEISKNIDSYIITNNYPYNIAKDMLCKEILPSSMKVLKDTFKIAPIKRKLKSTDDIEYFQEAWDYISQQVCGLILQRFNTWMDIDNLDDHIMYSIQKICSFNHDNKIFTYIIDNFAGISDKVHQILNQPLILQKFCKDQEIEVKLVSDEDSLFDITLLDGVKIQERYLSSDIVIHILSYISGKELCYMSMLNKEWATLLSNNQVWKCIYNMRNTPPKEVSSRINSWKFFTILNNTNLLQIPPMEKLTKLLSAFKSNFPNNPCLFNQFITNIFANTCVLDHSTSSDDYQVYNKLDVNLFIYWPNNEATKLSLSIMYDKNAEFRGCSKSSYVPPSLYFSLGDGEYSYTGNKLFQTTSTMLENCHFIGNYFATEMMNGIMATRLLICLIALSFGEDWLALLFDPHHHDQ